MGKNEQKPAIRFQGFTDAWEQRKLSDLVDVCSGRDYKHLSEGTIPVYGTGGYMLSVSEALSYDRDAIGIGRKGTIDKPYVLKAPFWTVDTLFYAVPKHPECLDFIHDIFQIIDWKKKDESTGVPSLSKEAINDTDVMVPKIDNLITLHQRKYDKLVNIKKSMLEKMFPRDGASVPEIRFSGFTDPWEQRKVGEVSKRVIVGLATSVTPYYREEGVPILRNLNIKENYLDDTDILFLDRPYAESQVSKQIHAGDVLTVHTGYIGISCVVPEKYDNCLTFTTLITTTDDAVLEGAFLAQYLNSEIGMSAVQAVTTQGGRQNLNTNDFVKVEIRYPSLAEQSKICAVLSRIDNLITLHQRKLEKLKNIKKSMLEKMFV